MKEIEKLEELVGDIHSPTAREDLESVISRLILVGVQPEEAILLTEKIWLAVYQEICFPNLEEKE